VNLVQLSLRPGADEEPVFVLQQAQDQAFLAEDFAHGAVEADAVDRVLAAAGRRERGRGGRLLAVAVLSRAVAVANRLSGGSIAVRAASGPVFRRLRHPVPLGEDDAAPTSRRDHPGHWCRRNSALSDSCRQRTSA